MSHFYAYARMRRSSLHSMKECREARLDAEARAAAKRAAALAALRVLHTFELQVCHGPSDALLNLIDLVREVEMGERDPSEALELALQCL